VITLRLPRSTLFPYTTLFRSIKTTLTVIAITLILNLLLNWKMSNSNFSYPTGDFSEKNLEVMASGIQGSETVQQSPQAVYIIGRSEEHTSELQSRENLVCRLL